MEKVTIRRTFSLGRDSFESISIEATGEGQTLEAARLCATHKVLELARIELNRVLQVKPMDVKDSVWDRVNLELNWIIGELNQK